MLDDTGKFTRLNVTRSNRLQKPFFYNKTLYAIAYLHRDIETVSFALGPDGTPKDYKELGRTPVADCHDSLATCLYRGQVYLFFDSAKADDRWKYHIRYKTTNSPDEGWLPADANGRETGLSGGYANWGVHLWPPCLGVRELNDKLHLFYYRDEYIYHAIFDGATWTEKGKLLDVKYHANFALSTATYLKEPVIVFGGRPQRIPDDNMFLSLVNDEGKVVQQGTMYLDWAQINNMWGIGQGSIKDSAQGNVIQVFCNNGGSKSDLRRTTFNLNTMSREGDWFDSTIMGRPAIFSFCDVVSAAVPVDTKGSFRQYLVVFSHYRTQSINSYASDHFVCEYTSPEPVNTGTQATEQRGAWTLLGVVEGVPPFTRNGVPGDEPTSFVDYGESRVNSVSVKQEFETSVSVGASVGVENVFGVGVELEATFGVANELTKTITRNIDIHFTNEDRNREGLHGWQVISKPSLQGRQYTRYSYDRTQNLGSFYVVSVVDVSIGIAHYLLAAPPKGMQARKDSTALLDWQRIEFPLYDGIDIHRINALTATLQGGRVSASLQITNVAKRSIKGTAKATLSGDVTLKKLFNISGSASFSYSHAIEVTSEFSQKISASLRLIEPKVHDKNTVSGLTTTPHWLIAADNARLNPARKPFWLADEYVPKGIIPWCLSWKVNEIRYDDGRVVSSTEKAISSVE